MREALFNALRAVKRLLAQFRPRIYLGLAVALIVGLGYLLFLKNLPEPHSWVGLKATSEYLAFKVVRTELAALRGGGLRAAARGEKPVCVDGVVEPKPGAFVEYRRGGPKELDIEIHPPPGQEVAAVLPAFGAKGAFSFKGDVELVQDAQCPGEQPTRFPVHGPAAFGHEPQAAQAGGAPAGVLLKGGVDVYALAQRRLLRMDLPPSVYLLSSFELPPGAVLCADIARDEDREPPKLDCDHLSEAGDDAPFWTGVATPSVFNNGFDIAVTTTAPGLILESTFTFGRKAPVRRIDLGGHDQFRKDPNILRLQIRFGALLLILQAVLSVIGFFKGEK